MYNLSCPYRLIFVAQNNIAVTVSKLGFLMAICEQKNFTLKSIIVKNVKRNSSRFIKLNVHGGSHCALDRTLRRSIFSVYLFCGGTILLFYLADRIKCSEQGYLRAAGAA